MKFRNVALGGLLAAISGAAMAQPSMDVSDAASFLTGDVMTAVGTLGAAALILVVAIKGWKRARSAV